jgi:hypothetical protein
MRASAKVGNTRRRQAAANSTRVLKLHWKAAEESMARNDGDHRG